MEQTPPWAAALIDQVAAIRAEMATRADLNALRAEMATRADFDAMRAEMATRADLGNLATHAELDELNASLQRIRAEIVERLEAVEKALKQQEQESVVNYATASISRQTLRSLEEQLTTVTRMVMQLSRRMDKIEGRPSDH